MAWYDWLTFPFDFSGDEGGGESATSSETNKPTVNKNIMGLQKEALNFTKKYIGGYVPGEAYGKPYTAPLSGYETQGLGFLQKYLDQPDYTPILSQAGDEVSRTLTGGYDPATSDYYSATRREAELNRGDAINQTRRDLASRGKFFSSERMFNEGDINARTSSFLNKTLVDEAARERQRKIDILPQAREINNAIVNAPALKAQLGTQIGALPRLVQNLDMEKQYQDFLRVRQEKQLPVNIAAGSVGPQSYGPGGTSTYPNQNYDSNPFGAALSKFAEIGTTALFSSLFGCWVAKEVFGGWNHPKTMQARVFIHHIGPTWFKDFYMKHGERFAEFISDKPVLKAIVKPVFELFAFFGKNWMVANGI